MKESPLLIVGLGNPGPKYANTRHNIGFRILEEVVGDYFANFSVHKKTNTEIAEARAGQRKLIFAKPRSYTNLSGGPVKALSQYFHVPAAEILVIHDELELNFAQIKLRVGGGDHGHNGLRSCTKSLGTKDYRRLSIGVGRPPGRMDPATFVLKSWTKAESAELPIICANAVDLLREHLESP